MGYCTVDDVRLLTGITSTDVDDTTVSSLISVADRFCDSRISEAGIDLPLTPPLPDTLKDASCHYTCAAVINRKRIDLSRPSSLNLGDISFSTTPDTEIQYHLSNGKILLERFIADTLSAAGESTGTIVYVIEGD